ncbi:restriction endonuclease subunit M [Sphingomonas sp. HHU CXW]|uniref:Restriction endonuclease subunit M n=1 Tax=Sphingomonas hominis TaxID=2741495 RepID=A0ABX2JQN8_9SPHN|nr:N-6 DNA methylase [Sphingomonas hominis]NTS66163.1 restriction endonuclease subunit M [Sphingomonas hominis]
MQVTDLIQRGIEAKLISIDVERKSILYRALNKKYRLSDPEELVRARAYVTLISEYGYPADQIDIEFPVPHRVPSLTADIVVFKDKARTTPFIVVECKREEASKGELDHAVEQGFGYANSLKAEFMWMTSGIRNDYFKVGNFGGMEREQNREPDIPRHGKADVAAARFTKGGVNGFDLKIVQETDLTRKFKQAHDALWAGGKRNPAEAFDELDKLIFCKIWDERANRKPGEPYDFQVFKNDRDRGDDLKKRIQAIYEQGRARDKEVFQDNIRLSNAELQTVVGYLADTNLSETDLDSKGRAFETFMTGFFRGEFGQYFTPRNIVKFIVDALPITSESAVIDTSCGSGGFLLHALDKVRRQADAMAEDGYFSRDSRQHWKHWHDFAENNLYGIEISEGIARTAKMNMIIHDDGHTNVISHDGLESIETMRQATGNQGFIPGTFDFIITNPPFGSKVKLAEKSYLQNYDLGRKDIDWIDAKMNNVRVVQKDAGNGEVIRLTFTEKNRDQQTTEVLFLEQCHRFLKPGGYMAMVIPDSILTNSSMQYVRNWIEEHWRIVSVVSLPQFAFAANGAGVKSSVLFLKRYDAKTTAAIQRIKEQTQDKLHDAKDGGTALEKLIAEKKLVLKRGDAECQRVDAEVITKAQALSEQGTLTPAIRKALKAEAEAAKAKHMETGVFAQWKADTNDDYNERIENLRETLNDQYLAEVKAEVSDYEIYMAIAEDIGYDATGRPTATNELEAVAAELSRFIAHIETGATRPFV